MEENFTFEKFTGGLIPIGGVVCFTFVKLYIVVLILFSMR